MAQATLTNERVEKVVYEDKEIITLKLSREEALVLAAILAKVGGQPSGSRGKSDSIARALDGLGICYHSEENFPHKNCNGHTYFND